VSLLGVPLEDQRTFLDWAEVLTAYIGGATDVPDRRRRALQGLRELSDYLEAHVVQRRAHPGDDLVSALLAAHKDDDELSVNEIVATSAMMLFAGHGSSTNAMGNGMLALLQNPDQCALLAAGRVSAAHAVEELLRYDSPVHVTVRTALRDGVLGREEILADDRVFLFIAAANRDPRRTERPEQLDLLRSNRVNHVTFGYGIHFCLGAPLARAEATIVFERLVKRFSRVELATDELQWKSTVGFRGLESLPLTVNA
jgi:cytochrome P450